MNENLEVTRRTFARDERGGGKKKEKRVARWLREYVDDEVYASNLETLFEALTD